MTQLTDDQLNFLHRHDVPLYRVFDATGMRAREYKVLMKFDGAWVAYGVTPCGAAGHSLRSRNGDCVQCRPIILSFLKRHDNDGEVYVAASSHARLIKVGTAKDSAERINGLRALAYGGATDWELHERIQCSQAGRIELQAHSLLERHRARDEYYWKDGYVITCRELFRCSAAEAVSALRAAAGLPNE